ncbi:1786_t:CDS:2 [Ambispora gerdemannii]|uniref:1786_t:CDS:1 n=1 Tax=Ambispora gerdemannii TaxID=144530 RepID=A0A9N8V9D3_9GLOM|nr:1786_t:CDS:2 [Ambispora gerdemannii]
MKLTKLFVHVTNSSSSLHTRSRLLQVSGTPPIPTTLKNKNHSNKTFSHNTAQNKKPFLPNHPPPRIYYDSPTSSANNSVLSLPEQQEDEDLDENVFYTTLKRDYPKVLHRVSLICVPHSRSIVGLKMTRAFIETHSLTPSPYFQGQYLSVNGKVVCIERNAVKAISGFKEARKVRILEEQLLYNETYSVRALILEKPLEGEGKVSEVFGMGIPTERNHETDLQFLQSFPNNLQSLMELTHAVAEFNETYVFVRGYAPSAVDKIVQLFQKAVQNIMESNSTIRSICKVQHEYDCFLELVENVLMSELHNKIFGQSLCPMYNSYDNYLESIIYAYVRAHITLRVYGVSERLHDMPEEMLGTACDILAALDDDDGFDYRFSQQLQQQQYYGVGSTTMFLEEEPCKKKSTIPAKTPLEKLICVKRAIQEIANAADTYLNQLAPRHGSDEDLDRSSITTDDFIPLLTYVIVNSGIRRLQSILFYMQTFRLSKVERSELSFALITLRASTEFLKSDPLAIHDSASTTSSISSMSSQSSHRLSAMSSNRIRSRSTSLSTPNTYQTSQNSNSWCVSMPAAPGSQQQQQHNNNVIKREKSPARSISSVSSMPAYVRTNPGNHYTDHRQSISDESTKSDTTLEDTMPQNIQSRQNRRPSSNLVIKPPILLHSSPKGRNSIDSDQWSFNENLSTSASAQQQNSDNQILLPAKPMISSPQLPELPLAAKTKASENYNDLPTLRPRSSSQMKRTGRHFNAPEIIATMPRALPQMRATTPTIELDPPGPEIMGDFLSSLQKIDGAVAGSRNGELTQQL